MNKIALAALTALILTGCNVTNPFVERKEFADNSLGYANKVCDTAGRDSDSCARAKIQVETRCFRTIGVVNCYVSEDPFGSNGSPRAFVMPVDGRGLTPSPG